MVCRIRMTIAWILLWAAPAATAGELTVSFDLSASELVLSSFDLAGDKMGSADLTIQADGPVTVLPGPVTLDALTFSVDLNAPIFSGLLTLIGPLQVRQAGPAQGTLTAGGAHVLFSPGALSLAVAGTVDCLGDLCGIAGISFPLTVRSGPTPSAVTQSLAVPGVSQSGSAMLTGALRTQAASLGMLTLGVSGREVQRVFDPGDTDGDGVPDDADECVISNLAPTVEIDGCRSRVPNPVDALGCTISDRVDQCAQGRSARSFVSCVARLPATRALPRRRKKHLLLCAALSSR